MSGIRAVSMVRGHGLLGLGFGLAVLVIVVFVLYPTIQIANLALGGQGRDLWARLLTSAETGRVIRNTLVVGIATGLLGTLLGLAMAFVQTRTEFRFKRALHFITLIPIVSPPFAVAMSIITLFGRSGLISKQLLGVRYDIFGADGLILSLVLSFMPAAYLSLMGMLQSFDPSLEEATADLGANSWARLRTLVFPLLAPGFANSFLLLFVSAIADLGNPLILGGSYTVLSSRLYLAIIGEFDLAEGAVLSLLLLTPSLLVFVLQYGWLRRRSFVTVTGRPVSRLRPITQRNVTWPLYGVATSTALTILVVYGYIVVGAFTKVWNINFTPSLDHFIFVFRGPGQEAIVDSLVLALVAMPLAGFAGLLLAFVVTMRQFPGRRILDFGSVVGVAMPGTVVGIGLILAYNQPLLGGLVPKLTGTAAIIVFALTVRSLPGVVRVSAGALSQLGSNLEEASLTLGATRGRAFLTVVLPLIRPALFGSLVWSFARSMTSLSAIIFLLTPEWRLIAAEILDEAQAGRFGNAAAFSVVLVVVMVGAMALLAMLTGFRPTHQLGTE
ncbi:MAG: ABC transporter permease [Egibacteraceae bacterium]